MNAYVLLLSLAAGALLLQGGIRVEVTIIIHHTPIQSVSILQHYILTNYPNITQFWEKRWMWILNDSMHVYKCKLMLINLKSSHLWYYPLSVSLPCRDPRWSGASAWTLMFYFCPWPLGCRRMGGSGHWYLISITYTPSTWWHIIDHLITHQPWTDAWTLMFYFCS